MATFSLNGYRRCGERQWKPGINRCDDSVGNLLPELKRVSLRNVACGELFTETKFEAGMCSIGSSYLFSRMIGGLAKRRMHFRLIRGRKPAKL